MTRTTLVNTTDQIHEVVKTFADRTCEYFDDASGIQGLINETQASANINALTLNQWNELFGKIGNLAIRCLGPRWEFQPFCELLLRKHTAYGIEPLSRWGLIGILIKVDQKVSRILNMKAKDQVDNYDESIFDNYRDIIGYCVLGHLLIEKGDTE